MGTEPPQPTVAEVARHAIDAVDPARESALVSELERQLEDRDEPIRAVGDIERLMDEQRRALDPEGDDPLLAVATAAITYVGFRRDEAEAEPEELIRLAVRAEFDAHPPEPVRVWLEQRGIEV